MAQITAVPFGSGINAGQILIQWDAYDQHLADRPITLSYSDTAERPWHEVAKDLPNTGKFNWRVDPSAGREVFLRLEVRDDAGNVNSHQLARPVNLEGLRPRGRIKTSRQFAANNSAWRQRCKQILSGGAKCSMQAGTLCTLKMGTCDSNFVFDPMSVLTQKDGSHHGRLLRHCRERSA